MLTFNSHNNVNITGAGLLGTSCPSLRRLNLGAMCTIQDLTGPLPRPNEAAHVAAGAPEAEHGLLAIARACPNLEAFSVSYVKGHSVSDERSRANLGAQLQAMLPQLKEARIEAFSNCGILKIP